MEYKYEYIRVSYYYNDIDGQYYILRTHYIIYIYKMRVDD